MCSPPAPAHLRTYLVTLWPATTAGTDPEGDPSWLKDEDVAADFLVNGRSASTVIPPPSHAEGISGEF